MRYNKVFLYLGSFSYILLLLGQRRLFVTSRTSLVEARCIEVLLHCTRMYHTYLSQSFHLVVHEQKSQKKKIGGKKEQVDCCRFSQKKNVKTKFSNNKILVPNL